MNQLNKQTLSQQVYDLLKQDIVNQVIPAGSKLTLQMLQTRFGLSSTPLREAMNRLSQEGLLEHVTNVGAKVIKLQMSDVHEIYDLCKVLDSAAMNSAFFSEEKAAFLSALADSVKQQRNALEAGDIHTFRAYSDGFHDIFFRYANNKRLYEASQRIRNQLSILIFQYQSYETATDTIVTDHDALVKALATGDFTLAQAVLSQHFDHSKNQILKAIEA